MSAYEIGISDWSSDVCTSVLVVCRSAGGGSHRPYLSVPFCGYGPATAPVGHADAAVGAGATGQLYVSIQAIGREPSVTAVPVHRVLVVLRIIACRRAAADTG